MNAMTHPNSSTSTPLQAWVEKLLQYMLACYGKRFTDQWCMVEQRDIVEVWAEELEGLSHAELKAGKEALAACAWPPTLPEFKRLCKPPVDPMKAYYEAVAGVQSRVNGEMGEWSHPAIYWAAMPLAVELREQTYSQVKARWEAALSAQLAKGAWDEIRKPQLHLAAPGKSTTGTEKARTAIREAAGQVMHRFASTDWAPKLLARHEAGEQLTPTQILFARQALGQA
jgi:hypothetical protein